MCTGERVQFLGGLYRTEGTVLWVVCTGQRVQFVVDVYRREGTVSGWCVQDRGYSFVVDVYRREGTVCRWCVQDIGYSVWILSDPPIMVFLGMSMSMALFSGVSRLGAGVGPLACRLFLINK